MKGGSMDAEFREKYRLLPTVKLVAIAGSDTSEYRPEAIDAARAELESRGESWENAEVVKAAKIASGDIVTRQEGELSPGGKCVVAALPPGAFLIGVIMACMPKHRKKGVQVLKWGGIGLAGYFSALVALFLIAIVFEVMRGKLP